MSEVNRFGEEFLSSLWEGEPGKHADDETAFVGESGDDSLPFSESLENEGSGWGEFGAEEDEVVAESIGYDVVSDDERMGLSSDFYSEVSEFLGGSSSGEVIDNEVNHEGDDVVLEDETAGDVFGNDGATEFYESFLESVGGSAGGLPSLGEILGEGESGLNGGGEGVLPALDGGETEFDKDSEIFVGGSGLLDVRLEVAEGKKASVGFVEVGDGGKVGLTGSDPKRKREGGRVSSAEARFFSNLGVNEWERGVALEELRAPVGGVESEKEADARMRKVLRGLRGRGGLERRARLVFRERDFEVIEFLARFKYATAGQLRYLYGVKEKTMSDRLGRLRGLGLVESYSIFGPRPIWYLTRLGQELSGYDLPGVPGRGLAYGMLSHTFVGNHTASNLMGGELNVLNLPEWPTYNRVGRSGDPKRGEVVVSELELQSSFGKVRMGKSDVYKPQLVAIKEKLFRDWYEGGMVGPSPEFLPGNEWMWVVLPGASAQVSYHVPDLVVSRQRDEEGRPRSIAVEIELNKKAKGYYRTLKSYASEKLLYDKLIWVCRSAGPARELARAGEELGLLSSGFMDIVPIIGDNGVFKGRELWAL